MDGEATNDGVGVDADVENDVEFCVGWLGVGTPGSGGVFVVAGRWGAGGGCGLGGVTIGDAE